MAASTPTRFLLLLTFVSKLVARANGQLDSLGLISIDCGIPDNTSYADPFTYRLVYVSDAGFTDAGLKRNVNPRYNDPTKAARYTTVRYFPTGARNCYTLRPLAPARGKYLVRATFYYGDYDGLNQLPVFDLHLGVNC